MSTYKTDDEQVEALKKWIKENGFSVIGGAVLGLSLVGGWQLWQRHTQGQAELASSAYTVFKQTVEGGDAKVAQAQGQRLIEQYGESTYGVYAALELARLHYQEGDADKARQQLEWALSHAGGPALGQVIRLRLGRLMLDQGDLAGLDQILAQAPAGDAYAGAFAELRGDLALARGDHAAAGQAYQEALDAGAENTELVRLKLADTGHVPAS